MATAYLQIDVEGADDRIVGALPFGAAVGDARQQQRQQQQVPPLPFDPVTITFEWILLSHVRSVWPGLLRACEMRSAPGS